MRWIAALGVGRTAGTPVVPPEPPVVGAELPSPLRTVNVATAAQLTSALTNAQAGDHIVLADGVYSLGGRMQLTRSGTSQNPIVVRAQNVLGAKLPGGFEYAAGTSNVWLWGLDFKDASFSRLRGQANKIRRCRLWAKPSYNGSAFAVVPESGSNGEISYCELRMHTTSEAQAENSSLWASGTQYGVVWNYHSTPSTAFTGLKIARCLLTGGPSGLVYSSPNCQFIEADGNTAAFYEYSVDWTIQDCYGNVPRDRTLFDFKCRGMRLIRCHVISHPNGAIQLRDGRDFRIERCRLSGYVEVCRGPGHLIANTVAGRYDLLAGECAYNAFPGATYHGQCYQVVMGNNSGPIRLGQQYSSAYTFPALDTLIEQHTGDITYGLHQGTVVRPTLQSSGVTPATPVTMTAAEVGPSAPWVGVE